MEKNEIKNCEINQKDVKEFCEYIVNKKVMMQSIFDFIILNLFFFLLVHEINLGIVLITIIFCLLYYILFSTILTKINTKKLYNNYKERKFDKYDITFESEFINIISANENSKVEYKDIKKIFENEIEYAIITAGNRYTIIPKRYVKDENIMKDYIKNLATKYNIKHIVKKESMFT